MKQIQVLNNKETQPVMVGQVYTDMVKGGKVTVAKIENDGAITFDNGLTVSNLDAFEYKNVGTAFDDMKVEDFSIRDGQLFHKECLIELGEHIPLEVLFVYKNNGHTAIFFKAELTGNVNKEYGSLMCYDFIDKKVTVLSYYGYSKRYNGEMKLVKFTDLPFVGDTDSSLYKSMVKNSPVILQATDYRRSSSDDRSWVDPHTLPEFVRKTLKNVNDKSKTFDILTYAYCTLEYSQDDEWLLKFLFSYIEDGVLLKDVSFGFNQIDDNKFSITYFTSGLSHAKPYIDFHQAIIKYRQSDVNGGKFMLEKIKERDFSVEDFNGDLESVSCYLTNNGKSYFIVEDGGFYFTDFDGLSVGYFAIGKIALDTLKEYPHFVRLERVKGGSVLTLANDDYKTAKLKTMTTDEGERVTTLLHKTHK